MEESSSNADWIQQVLARYQTPLIRFASSITGNLETARDVVQDTFLSLLNQPRDRIEGHLAQWLFTVCRNRALDLVRKEGRMKTTSVDEIQREESPSPTPPEIVELRQTRGSLTEMIDRLPARQQEVLRLKFEGGLSYREISEVTGLTVSNVGVILHTVVKALRDRLHHSAAGERRLA